MTSLPALVANASTLGLLARLAVAFVALHTLACQEAPERTQEDTGAQPVTTTIVKLDSLRETVRGIGSVRALEQVEVRPETNGIVRRILFEDGVSVKRGQILYRLDSDVLHRRLGAQRAALSAARAQHANAQGTMQRRAQLLADGVVTPAEYQLALTQLQQAQADVERFEAEVALIREQIGKTEVRSPLAGMISQSIIDPGTFVAAGQHLATVYRESPLEVEFTIPERFVAKIQLKQSVELHVTSMPDEPVEAVVSYVSPSVTEASRDMVAKARIADPPDGLKPGMFATVVVTLQTHKSQPVLPEEALVGTRKGYIVFLVENDTARRRDVEIGLREPGTVEIRKGLEAGDVVVRSGHINIEDGSKVEVVEEQREAEDGGSMNGG